MKHPKRFEHQFILPLNLLLIFFLTPTHAVDTITQDFHKNTYIVGSELDYPPYALVDEQGQADGFSVDLIKAVARVMQLSFEFRVGPWSEVKSALERGEIDILPFVAYSKERDRIFDFTVPHTITYDTYFMRTGETPLDSEQTLQDKAVVVMRADSTYEYLKENAYTKNLILTKTVPESLRLLATGKYDYAFVPRLVGLLTIKKLHLHNLETTGPIVDTSHERGYAFAVKEGNDNLLMTLNEGLSVIKATGEYDEIYQKWFASIDDSQTNFESIYRYLLISGFLLLLIAIVVSLWLITLKKQVASRTADLMAEISERKQIEKALQESTAQLQTIFDNTAVGIILADTAGKFLKVNIKWVEMTGYSVAELKQLNIQDITYSEDNQISLAQLKTLTNGKINSFQMEKRYVRKDQSIFWGSASVSPFYHADGSVQGAIGVITNITERKETELALQTSEARFRDLVDAIPYGVEEIDTEGRIIFTNIARNQMLGFTEDDIAGNKTIWDFMDDASKQEVRTLFTHLLENQPIPTPVFGINYTKTGQAFEVQVDWNYKRDTTGHIVGFVAVLTNVTQQKQTERALRESEEKYRLLFQLFPVGVSITDPEGQLIEANPFSEKLLDISVPEHLKHRYDDDSWHLIRPDGTLLPVEEYASVRVLKEQKTFTNMEMGIVKYDKRITWLSVSATPIPLEQYGVAITYVDITERKAIEEALQKSEARLAEAQKLARLGFWEWDLITGEEHCSKELWQILGLSPEKTLFTHELFERAIYPTDSDTVLNAFAHAITEDKHYDLVFRIVRPDNTIRHVHALGRLIRDPKGKIQRFIGTAQDITKRKLVEEALRINEQHRRTLIEEALIGLILIDKAGTLIEVNSAFAKMIGYTPEEIAGHLNCLEITPPEYLEEDKRQVHLLKERKRFGPYEKEYLHRNGQRVPVRVSGLLIEHKEQKFAWTNVENIATQKHTEDILRAAKEAAEAANHAKSTFLANMSHELRTPLNGILGYTQLFKLDRNLTPEQQEGIDVIHRSGEHLLSLINDILDLSKVEAGRVELQKTDFNFKSFIDGIIYLFKMRAQQRDIIFNYEQLSHLPHTIHADETRLRQILMNLLGNAVKFTQQRTCLKIGYHLEKIRFQVEDDGIGIADSDVEKIFLPFHQVGDARYKTQGTGLGLSITKKLVTMMGGTIQVTSVLGKGSVFWVELELPEVLNSEQEKKAELIKKPRIVGFEESARKILIVDDIKENRLILLNYLRPLGFEVLEAAEGEEGINMAIEQRPALILMDLVMPKIDGFEAVRQLRKLPTLKDVIIIAISASVFDFYQQKSINVGCNDFIAKPFHYEELLEKIQQHLNLNWVYEIDDDDSDMPLKFEGPSPEQANTLLDLAMQGDILGITSYMTELTKQNDTLVLFASEVCHLARNFKTAKICELARRYLTNK